MVANDCISSHGFDLLILEYSGFITRCIKSFKILRSCRSFWMMSSIPQIWSRISDSQKHLAHWCRMTHICVSDLTSMGSDDGLSPDRHQAIIRTNAGILLMRPLGTNYSKILIEILILFSFKKMSLKVSSAKRWPFCRGLNELIENMFISLALWLYLCLQMAWHCPVHCYITSPP